ncbi:MAG: nitronate monooxygenase [Dehalococcoidia bacterium]|nr:nitronate monooxygenase [Dehalococcoidia bacterium]
MNWSTRVTELLGCEYPIIQGAYGGFGTSAIAAPVSAAGGCGIITAGALKTPERLREDIRRAREMTDKPFAVNISMIHKVMDIAPQYLDVVIEEKIPVLFTAAYKAEFLGQRAKAAGLKWVHKVATIKHALAAERQGADAVVLVGLEGAGFKSTIQVPTLIGITALARTMKVPLIAAGGIGDARGFLAALAMGAEGVYLGTRFMATRECPISDRAKQMMVDGDPLDPKYRDHALIPPKAEILERVKAQRGSKPMAEWLTSLENAMVGFEGETDDSSNDTELVGGGLPSLAIGVIDNVPTCKELIDSIIAEAEELLLRSGPLARILANNRIAKS